MFDAGASVGIYEAVPLQPRPATPYFSRRRKRRQRGSSWSRSDDLIKAVDNCAAAGRDLPCQQHALHFRVGHVAL